MAIRSSRSVTASIPCGAGHEAKRVAGVGGSPSSDAPLACADLPGYRVIASSRYLG